MAKVRERSKAREEEDEWKGSLPGSLASYRVSLSSKGLPTSQKLTGEMLAK